MFSGRHEALKPAESRSSPHSPSLHRRLQLTHLWLPRSLPACLATESHVLCTRYLRVLPGPECPDHLHTGILFEEPNLVPPGEVQGRRARFGGSCVPQSI